MGRFVQTLGSRKLWIWLRGQGHDVARCTVERIMGEQGWEGARYRSKHKTTVADDSHVRYPDLVDRRFYPATPNLMWVADFTYVSTWQAGGAVLGAGEEGMLDGVEDQVGGHRSGGPPPEDPATVGIDHERHVHEPHPVTSPPNDPWNLRAQTAANTSSFTDRGQIEPVSARLN
jgi:hypothetical protein